jgi:hypothetical protein
MMVQNPVKHASYICDNFSQNKCIHISDNQKMLINADLLHRVSSYPECWSPAKWLYKGSVECAEVYKGVRR